MMFDPTMAKKITASGQSTLNLILHCQENSGKSEMYHNPMYSDTENLEIAIGAILFRDKVIDNLRQQISNLRQMAKDHKMSEHVVDHYQFKHLADKV